MRFIYSKIFLIFFTCSAVVVFFVFLQTKGLIDPIEGLFLQIPRPLISLVKSTTETSKDFFHTIFSLREVVKENRDLRIKVSGLQQDLVNFEEEKKENIALRSELGFVKTVKTELVPCSVLGRNSLGISDTIVVNCGSNQGLEEGLAVISGGYLAGKIIYVSKNTSTVLLANSSKFSVDGKIVKTDLKTIVKGSFGSGLVLDQLPQNEKVEKGWVVATAGINEKIPKNFVIGEVGEVTSASSELFKKMTVISPVDFNNLNFVFVARQ